MNSMYSISSYLPLKPSSNMATSVWHLPLIHNIGFHQNSRIHNFGFHQNSRSVNFLPISLNSLPTRRSSISSTIPSNEGSVSVVEFEDFVEKDWSFLDTNSDEEDHIKKIDRIISAGEIVATSKVLVSIGSETFVDRVVETSPCELLLVVHDSLFTLACIKEKYDKVKCWQGELVNVPEKWTDFNVAYLYFLPGLPFELNDILGALAKRCLPGARVVVSHPDGRQVVEEQRQEHPDVVVSNLPEKPMLESVAAEHSFEVVEFADEPGFYLAVLRLVE